jgi:hypothetical protein
MAMSDAPPPIDPIAKAFISYSWDDQHHKDAVEALAKRLVEDAVDVSLDVWEPNPAEGWPTWMLHRIREADFVLVVCTQTYKRRFEGYEAPKVGRGARFEGVIITNEIYAAECRNTRFLPVVLSPDDSEYVPGVLASSTRFDVSNGAGYKDLYRLVSRQPERLKPPLGTKKSLPPEQGAPAARIESVNSNPAIATEVAKRSFGVLRDQFARAGETLKTPSVVLNRFTDSGREMSRLPQGLAETFGELRSFQMLTLREPVIRAYKPEDEELPDFEGKCPRVIRAHDGRPVAVREPAVYASVTLHGGSLRGAERLTSLASATGKMLQSTSRNVPGLVTLARMRKDPSPAPLWWWSLCELAWHHPTLPFTAHRRFWVDGNSFEWSDGAFSAFLEFEPTASLLRNALGPSPKLPDYFYAQIEPDAALASALAVESILGHLRT